MTQKEILQELLENTHTLWAPSFVEKVNDAFGTSIKCHSYIADGHRNPKGLSLHDKGDVAIGLACFDLAPILCSALGVKYEYKLGRGFQVQACVEALRNAGHGTED